MTEMFDVLRASLFTDEAVTLADWRPVFEEMKQQTVASLAGAWLPRHLDAEPWMTYCLMRQADWVRLMHAQDRLLQLMEANHIPCVIPSLPNPTKSG